MSDKRTGLPPAIILSLYTGEIGDPAVEIASNQSDTKTVTYNSFSRENDNLGKLERSPPGQARIYLSY